MAARHRVGGAARRGGAVESSCWLPVMPTVAEVDTGLEVSVEWCSLTAGWLLGIDAQRDGKNTLAAGDGAHCCLSL